MESRSNFMFADLFGGKRNERSSLLETLSQNVLFQTLSKRELKYLAQFVYERVYNPGEPIFQQNERGLGMYLIAKGRVSIRTASSQQEVVVATLGEGSFFGELALVDPSHLRTANAIATERSMLVGFFQPDLLNIVERKPEMGAKILLQLSSVLGRRLVETTERLTAIHRVRDISKAHEEIV
jgi:CRP/FNR family cyclic AMP-dependent transcriptional regulator